MRGRAGLEKREGREKSRAAAHLTPVASRASFAGWERKFAVYSLRCGICARDLRVCVYPKYLVKEMVKKQKAVYYVGYKQEHDSLEFKTFSQCLHQ